MLLAALIQCEAACQPYEGQVAVGAVVMNRVNSGAYPNTIAGVIYASGQFTPTRSNRVETLAVNVDLKLSGIPAYVILNDGLSGDFKGESDVAEIFENAMNYNILAFYSRLANS